MTTFNLSILVRAIDKASAPLRGVASSIQSVAQVAKTVRAAGLDRIAGAVGGIGSNLGNVVSEAGALAAKVSLIGGGIGWLFKSQFVDSAAQFERFQTMLTTVEGSSDKARASMSWISDFAAKTPYRLAEVTDAFVKMRAYGIAPQSGALSSLGDAAASLNKPLMQMVEALADAKTGQFERLKEALGVQYETVDDMINVRFSDQAGKAVSLAAAKNDAAAIERMVLNVIKLRGYGGGMDRLSKTWDGMVSNLADAWTRFANMVMDAGVFDWMNDQLRGILSTVDAMAKSGELQRWATELGTTITGAFAAVKDFLFGVERVKIGFGFDQIMDPDQTERVGGALRELRALFEELSDFLRPLIDRFGATKVIVGVLAVVVAGPLVAALAGLAGAFIALGAAMLATPVGWVAAAIAALVAGAALIYANWNGIGAWWDGLWSAAGEALDRFLGSMTAALSAFDPAGMIVAAVEELVLWVQATDLYQLGADLVGSLWQGLQDALGAVSEWFKSGGINVAAPAAAGALGQRAGTALSARASAAMAQQSAAPASDSTVTVRFENLPPAANVSARRDPGANLDLDLGYAMVAP